MRAEQVLLWVVEWVQREPVIALVSALGAYLLLLVLILVMFVRLIGLSRKQARLLRGADGASLERMLLEQADGAQEVREQIAIASRTSGENAESIRLCMQKVGLVRYDAFADVGGEQSFSLALLDDGNNGVVISGLFSRNDMRVYAKPVVAGASPMSLTDEERKAISGAHTGGPVTQQGGRSNGRGMVGGRR